MYHQNWNNRPRLPLPSQQQQYHQSNYMNWNNGNNRRQHANQDQHIPPLFTPGCPSTSYNSPSSSNFNNEGSRSGYMPNQEQEYYESYNDDYSNDANGNDFTDIDYGRREEKLARKTQTFYCEVCNVFCTGEPSYQQHLDGKSHKRKMGLDGNSSLQLRKRAAFHCEVCNTDCSSEDAYNTHINGQKHQKAIMVLMKTNKPIPTTEVTVIPPAGAESSSTNEQKKQSENKQQRKRPNSVGFDKINPNLVPLGSATICIEALNDRHLLDKVARIGLNVEQEKIVEDFVLLVEDALYDVSCIMEADRSIPPTTKNQTESRLLRGVMRVGILANKLLLKADKRIDLVVLCSVVPTTDLLFQIFEHFRRIINQNINNEGIKKIVYTSAVVKESAISVSQEGIPIVLFVTFTCSLMRQWSPGDLNYHSYVIPPNALPKESCLYALAEMRRTKYYQVKCEPYESMNSVAKIVRDFAYRIPAWKHFNDWMIVLILGNIFSGSENPLGPSAALKSLFTAISEGHILGPNYKLPDPCEKFPIDAVVTLAPSDRTQIFSSARYALRQMNTNNLPKLLGLDGSPGIPTEPFRKKKKMMADDDDGHNNSSMNPAEIRSASVGLDDRNPLVNVAEQPPIPMGNSNNTHQMTSPLNASTM